MTEKYPEHQRLKAISGQSQVVYDFLEWCGEEKGYCLAVWATEDTDRMWPVRDSKRKLLAEFFDIDMDKIEAEKRAVLDEMRAMNGGQA